jgi:N-acetylmuramic acid 6-phosphate etherase
MGLNSQIEAEAFLAIADDYRLGELPTEQGHALTADLSRWAQADLAEGFRRFQRLDVAALRMVEAQVDRIQSLAAAVAATFAAGQRVFLAGCGATGRLALTVETLCREGLVPEVYQDRVVGFMAGGDAALIRSLEGFEDRADYGQRQLQELGFSDGDLMIGVTEGGETPFVIAATEHALRLGNQPAWFCYCNPDESLKAVAERSRRILENPRIERLPLITGPMALAGSTRLQATTVQLAALLLAIEYAADPAAIPRAAQCLREAIERLDYAAMEPLTQAECEAIAQNQPVLYTTQSYGLTVLTDTTERAPTFSQYAFENTQSPEQPASLCYLSIDSAADTQRAWAHLLRRAPRTLEWPEVQAVAGRSYLYGYDISERAMQHRLQKTGRQSLRLGIEHTDGGIEFSFANQAIQFSLPSAVTIRNLALKVLLNSHSTLLMGRLGRFEGNLMTWVRPSNNKLIDRAIRYIRQLCERRGLPIPSYEHTCRTLFEVRASMPADAAIVLETLKALEPQSKI